MLERGEIAGERFFHAQQVHVAIDIQALESGQGFGRQHDGAGALRRNFARGAIGLNGFFARALLLNAGLHPPLDLFEDEISRHTQEPRAVPAPQPASRLLRRAEREPSALLHARCRKWEYWHPIRVAWKWRPSAGARSDTTPKPS